MADDPNAQGEQSEQGEQEEQQDGSGAQRSSEERLIPDEEVSDDGQVYVDRDKIDFDPEEGLYSGTAVHGGTDIPGPHEQVDDVDPNDVESDGDSDSESEAADNDENGAASD